MTVLIVLVLFAGCALALWLAIRPKRGVGIPRRLADISETMIPGPVHRRAFDDFAACAGTTTVPFSRIKWRVVKQGVPVDDFSRFQYRLGGQEKWVYGVAEGETIVLARAARNDHATSVHEVAHLQGYEHEDETFIRCVPIIQVLPR